MSPTFVFEPPSDEEFEMSESEDEEQVDEEEAEESEEEEEDDDGGRGGRPPRPSRRHSQSPWDFSSYSESVAEEHARRSTTSVDFKISKALQQLSNAGSNPPAAAADDEESEGSEAELDRQVTTSLSLSFFSKLFKPRCFRKV